MVRKAKVVHDDLNAGGGSERLAVVTINLLIEMGFRIDLASFKKPDVERIKRDFGNIASNVEFNEFKPLDLFSMLHMASAANTATDPHKENVTEKEGSGGSTYDLVINTHGDLLPYYERNEVNDEKRLITYCHFPLVPQMIKDDHSNGYYTRLLLRWANASDGNGTSFANRDQNLKGQLLSSTSKMYDLMMRNTTILTNSHFSKKAIEERYGAQVKPTVIYPPVEVEKFRDSSLNSNNDGGRSSNGSSDNDIIKNRQNVILVVSRFSPGKKIENAIELGKILKEKENMMAGARKEGGPLNAKIILVGNVAPDDQPYLQKLRAMARECGLEESVSFEVSVSFDRLLELMKKSKIYFHPLEGEPFGISIVEAMSAGLIPVVPDEGGYTEFVPEQYQFHTHEQAADIISKILLSLSGSFAVDSNNNNVNDFLEKEMRVSESVSRFSTESYKAGLKKVIESVMSSPSKTDLPLSSKAA